MAYLSILPISKGERDNVPKCTVHKFLSVLTYASKLSAAALTAASKMSATKCLLLTEARKLSAVASKLI